MKHYQQDILDVTRTTNQCDQRMAFMIERGEAGRTVS